VAEVAWRSLIPECVCISTRSICVCIPSASLASLLPVSHIHMCLHPFCLSSHQAATDEKHCCCKAHLSLSLSLSLSCFLSLSLAAPLPAYTNLTRHYQGPTSLVIKGPLPHVTLRVWRLGFDDGRDHVGPRTELNIHHKSYLSQNWV
jgi:hypothetical protein